MAKKKPPKKRPPNRNSPRSNPPSQQKSPFPSIEKSVPESTPTTVIAHCSDSPRKGDHATVISPSPTCDSASKANPTKDVDSPIHETLATVTQNVPAATANPTALPR
ncbi:hypothetical protein YC2023_017642 [Brassica napus]|uniref:(rape) hypothetical protein n=1 Tax=Brassica napus TaxID=3708 RepID=A0A816KE60_BRANA|nr:unnamed protein product [Brassica napus]